MPSRLSRLFKRRHDHVLDDKDPSDEVFKKADTTSTEHQTSVSSRPPSYHSIEKQDQAIPKADITAGFRNLNIRPEGTLPTQEECIAHLKLLECFYRLRQNVSSCDGLFDIHDDIVHSLHLTDDEAGPLLIKLAEKRWAIYVTRAVDRFQTWRQRWTPSYGRLGLNELDALGGRDQLLNKQYLKRKKALVPETTQQSLPPIDVLLVWHSYMLNPRAYLEDCLRGGFMHLWHQPFPLDIVANAIDAETLTYDCDEQTQRVYVELTGSSWDNLESDFMKSISCPLCDGGNEVVWSKILDDTGDSDASVSERIEQMLSAGQGYCDRGFQTYCSKCGVAINHEYLKLGKLCADLRLLRNKDWYVMPGTVFGRRGLPGKIGKEHDRSFSKVLATVNELFRGSMGSEIIRLRKDKTMTMRHAKIVVQFHLKDSHYLKQFRSDRSPRLTQIEQAAIRRVMSRYWENDTPFAIDLVGAVVRQCSFTGKMHDIDWLHSPALFATVSRLRTKYSRFLTIMAASNEMVVPTLDVDLAWHTHQLDPQRYCYSTVDIVKQFVDHDDKVPEVQLSDGFADTARRYQNMFKEPYSECTCWYCEAVRESVSTPADRLSIPEVARAVNQLHEVEQDPKKSVHISSHNATRPIADAKYERAAKRKTAILDAAYNRVCDKAKAQGKPVPKRDHFYYSDAYGYPVYIGAYEPFVGPMACTPLLYPMAPGCMAVIGGAAQCAASSTMRSCTPSYCVAGGCGTTGSSIPIGTGIGIASCGGGISSCVGGISSCAGASSSNIGGFSSCGGSSSACGGGGVSSCGGGGGGSSGCGGGGGC